MEERKNGEMRRKEILVVGILMIGILLAVGVYAQFGGGEQAYFSSPTTNYQYASPNFNNYYTSEHITTYWPILRDIENDQCEATSDFIVAIRPGGCTPPVVRSDLLEEQNVPVFCQLGAVKINPLIKVSSIRSISFKGTYPPGVAGISFHPARAAVRSYDTLLGSPLVNNIGYVVIILQQNRKEKEMPEWVSGDLTATVYYDAEKAYGVGKSEFYLPAMTEEEWKSESAEYGFWYGRGFVRVIDIDGDQYGFLIPKEGTIVDLENLAIPATCEKPELAHKLIDFLISKKIEILNFNAHGCNPSNKLAYDEIDQRFTKDKAFFPDDKAFAKLYFIHNKIPAAKIEKLWFSVKAA